MPFFFFFFIKPKYEKWSHESHEGCNMKCLGLLFNKQFEASFLQDVTRNSLFKLLLILNWCWRNFESCVEWFPGFSSLYFKISPKNSGHLLKKLDSKLKPITPWSRAPISFFAFTLSSVWLLVVYFFPLIGCHDTFDLVLMTLNGNALFVKSAQFSR